MKHLPIIVATAYLCLFCIGCTFRQGDYEVALPNGYKLARIYENGLLVADASNSVILHPNVEKYTVLENFVVGVCGRSRFPSSQEPFGYFIIDTKTGEVQSGLSDVDFQAVINTCCGLSEIPDLRVPDRNDDWTGR